MELISPLSVLEVIHVTELQRRWLTSRGGRRVEDVHVDGEGMYVFMGSGVRGVDKRVYLPSNETLQQEYHDKLYRLK